MVRISYTETCATYIFFLSVRFFCLLQRGVAQTLLLCVIRRNRRIKSVVLEINVGFFQRPFISGFVIDTVVHVHYRVCSRVHSLIIRKKILKKKVQRTKDPD